MWKSFYSSLIYSPKKTHSLCPQTHPSIDHSYFCQQHHQSPKVIKLVLTSIPHSHISRKLPDVAICISTSLTPSLLTRWTITALVQIPIISHLDCHLGFFLALTASHLSRFQSVFHTAAKVIFLKNRYISFFYMVNFSGCLLPLESNINSSFDFQSPSLPVFLGSCYFTTPFSF